MQTQGVGALCRNYILIMSNNICGKFEENFRYLLQKKRVGFLVSGACVSVRVRVLLVMYMAAPKS
jgi:hypothetical protein